MVGPVGRGYHLLKLDRATTFCEKSAKLSPVITSIGIFSVDQLVSRDTEGVEVDFRSVSFVEKNLRCLKLWCARYIHRVVCLLDSL